MKALADLRQCPNWGGEKVVNGMKAVNIISVNLQWLIFENLEIMSSSRFQKIYKLVGRGGVGGEFLQAHLGNLANYPVADFRKSAMGGGFLQAHVGNLANCPVADFRKSATGGGNFCKCM